MKFDWLFWALLLPNLIARDSLMITRQISSFQMWQHWYILSFFNFKQMSWFSKTTGASNNWKRQFSVQCTCSYFWAGHSSAKWVVAFLLAGSLLIVRQKRKQVTMTDQCLKWRWHISRLSTNQPKRVMILAKT